MTYRVESSTEKKGDKKILDDAHARLKLSEEADSEIRRLSLEDLEFRSGKQWPDAVERDRNTDGRPCLVINRLPQFIQQVTNDQRQNRPSIRVHPVDSTADVETAKVIQGLIRHIEYDSNADTAYDTAFESAVTGGFGYIRIITQYSNPKSFDQDILIKRIRNPYSVFFDPASQEPDGSDANWAFVIEDLSPEEYKAKYSESELSQDGNWEAVGNSKPDWVTEDYARVAEYFYKEFKEVDMVLLSNGQAIEKENLDDYLAQNPGQPIQIINERKAQVPVIKWCKLNGCEILESTEWPGIYIPIIPVYGNELYIDGKRILEGIVRNAKDSQRMYNYWKSAETEAIALAPRAPFLAAEGQLEGYEDEWATANRRSHSVLHYKPISNSGQLVGPPQRQVFEPAVQAITQASMMAADDLKATTGIYDAALGARSNENSGVAIQRRNMQSQTSNFHFIDNLTRSLRHAGRILVDLIPKIYDTQRAARIIGEDGEQKIVQLNAPFEQDGKALLYQLDAGKYDVTVDVGPSYASKRQEAAASMLDLSKANPQIMQIAGDLMVKNMDWPGAQEIAERLKKTLPPGLADDGKKQQNIPPEVQQKMEQMGQMLEQVTNKLKEAQEREHTKMIEIESRERIEFKKLEVELEIERAKLDAKDSVALLNAEIASIEKRLSMLDINQQINPEPQYGAPMSAVPGMEQNPTGGESPGQPMEEGYEP